MLHGPVQIPHGPVQIPQGQHKNVGGAVRGEDCAAARMEENVKRIDPDAVWRPTRGPAQRDANQARKRHGEADPFNRYKNILTYAVHLIKRFVFRCRRLAAHVIILKKYNGFWKHPLDIRDEISYNNFVGTWHCGGRIGTALSSEGGPFSWNKTLLESR